MSERAPDPRPAQEDDRVSGRSAARWWGATVAAVVVCALAAWGAARLFGEGPLEMTLPAAAGDRPPGTPDPRVGSLRRPYDHRPHTAGPDSAVRIRLESYRWVDREGGVAAVPAWVAAEILVEAADALARPDPPAGSHRHRPSRGSP